MKYFLLLCLSYLYLNANAHIFVYHRFGDSKHESTNTSLQELEKEFEYFKANNYKVVTVSKIVEKLKNKEQIPNNWVAFTIDDAYKSFYQNGLELFKKYNYPFTLFVYVEATQKKYPDFMTWDEIKEASKYGEIELHSYSHKQLVKLTNEEIIKDTNLALEIFEKNLGFKPKAYSYPYGEYDERVKNEIKNFDFEYIMNQNNGSVNEKSDLFDLNRIALVGKINLEEKIKYKTLEANWIEPQVYPKDGILKHIKVEVNKDIKNAKLFISTYGWQDIKVKNGIIDIKLDKKLNLNRNRIAISTDYYTISNKLLIK
ncbi:MAG: polysaccharide deacetylase family protein [Arcobacter sp.]|jgi:peptidoglycan/xylan/chitin deacetylase (PgdA/CDA1 family)|uniref:polysaccharide deacetylase family protein n=1 Tax=Arcobacter sp. TaxID=1872629 RepID=UPI002590B14C|nr:polysaccharide deacetylase family protein [Arcobacter sp.]MDD3007227.1 polysaccharide deacetylase family protein [Arcobacter sp.]MDY3205578.1 polysaccharide deacetylase family protein [Arcobacter sp.]